MAPKNKSAERTAAAMKFQMNEAKRFRVNDG